jgi:hypothetical protein
MEIRIIILYTLVEILSKNIYLYAMKKILYILLLLPFMANAQITDLNEAGLNATIDLKQYYTETPRLKLNEYGKMKEHSIRLGDDKIMLTPTNKVVTGKKMMAEVNKLATEKIKGVTIKMVKNTPTEAILSVTRDGKTEYKSCCIVMLKGKEYFAMCETENELVNAEHLIEIARTIKSL